MSVYIRKDHWTPTEDNIVKAAVMKYGTNQWSRVASLLVRKSAAQCKARWYERLDPRLSQASWSSHEDNLLLKLQRMMPNMWRSIGATLGGRTAAQCFERWSQLDSSGRQSSRELLEDVEVSESEEEEVNSDSERQMIAEARARLSNSLGKKAKRKRRELMDSEEAFKKSILDHRATGAPIRMKRQKFAAANQGVPFEALSSGFSPETHRDSSIPYAQKSLPSAARSASTRAPRKPGRPKLVLPAPLSEAIPEETRSVVSPQERERVRRLLKSLPPPRTGNTLASHVSLDPITEQDDESTDSTPGVADEVPMITLDEVLAGEDPSADISTEARILLQHELPSAPPSVEHNPKDFAIKENSEALSVSNEKYWLLKQRLLDFSRLTMDTKALQT